MDYRGELKKIEDDKAGFIDIYGKKQYEKAVKYYRRKINYEQFETTDVSPAMKEYDSLISDTPQRRAFLKKYGPDQLETALEWYGKKADAEIDNAWNSYQSALKAPKLSTVQKYGLQADYSDSYDDQIRKIAGAVPASFDVSQYTKGIQMPDGYQMPTEWDDQSVDLLLSARQKAQQPKPNVIDIAKQAISNVAQSPQMQQVVKAKQDEKQAEYDKYLGDAVLKYMNWSDVDSGEIKPYEDLYTQIYGKAPTSDDLKNLSRRLSASQNSALLNDTVMQALENIASSNQLNILGLPTSVNGMADDLFKKELGKTVKELTGKDASALTYDDIKALKQPVSAQDEEYLSKAKALLEDINTKNAERAQNQGKDMGTAFVAGGNAADLSGLVTGLQSAGSYVMQGLGTIADLAGGKNAQYWADWREYNAEKKNIDEQMDKLRLESTKGYTPTVGAITDIASNVADVGASVMIGNIAGGVMAANGTMLTNPYLSKGVIDTVMPNPTLKTMFIEQFGNSLNRFEKEDMAGAPALALLESTVLTYIEGMGGIAGEQGLITKGLSKMPKNKLAAFAKNWATTSIEELGEESAQSLVSGGIDAATGKPFSQSDSIQQWTDPTQLANMGISVAVMSGIFGLNGLGVNTDAATDAYMSGEFDRAAQIVSQQIDSAINQNINNTDKQTLEAIQSKLAPEVETTPDGEIAIPEIPTLDINQIATETGKTQQNGAQAATDTIMNAANGTQVHKSATSLLEAYADTDYGDLLAAEIEKGGASYTPESAVKDLDAAMAAVKSGTLTANNYATVQQDNGELKSYNKTDVVRLMALIDDAVQRGDTAAYDQLNAAVFDVGLQLGRGVQAFALLQKASPATHLASIEREIARFNIDGQKKYGAKWTDVSLTSEEKQAILNGKTVDERTASYQQAIQRIQENLPSTAWEKFDQLRKTSMLFNPRTQIRNIAGNAMYELMNALNRKVEAGIQLLLPQNKRTTVLKISPEYRAMAKDDFNNVKDAYKGESRYNMDAKLGQGYQQAFKNKGIGKRINQLSKLTGTMLDVGDVIFGKHHYETALAAFMQARGLKEITGEARAYALDRALEATFRAESETANAINDFIRRGRKNRKGQKNVLGGAASVVMPFVKTPINIAKESFDFSPLGMGKSLTLDLYRVVSKKMTATQFIHNLSKGLTGTAVSALGFLLAQGMLIPGVELTGAPPEDEKEREFLYAQGWKPYALKIGDVYFPVSWAQPVATTMMMGVTLSDTIGKNEDFSLVDVAGLTSTLFDSIAEISPLAGLKDLLQYNDTAGEAALSVGSDLVTQFIPAIGRQVGRIIDPREFDTYTGGTLEQLKNQGAVAVGAPDQLDVAQKVDIWGHPQTQEGDWFERFIQNMVSPTNISVAPQDAINDEIMRLYKSTGNANVLPKVFDKRKLDTADVKEILGSDIELTAKDLQALKEGMGQSSRAAVESYINSEQYKADDDTARVKTINGMYEAVRALYRQAKARGLDLSTVADQTAVQAQEYFSGESTYDSPIPDAAMLVDEYDYGVDSSAADALFSLYKDTGDKSFLLEPEDTFKLNNKTFEYQDDPRVDLFQGYTDSTGEAYQGLNDIINSVWFGRQDDKQKAKIVDDVVSDILSAIKKDTAAQTDPLAALMQKPSTDTKAYEAFNSPGWSGYGPDDEVIKQLDSLGVYPKNVDSFAAKNDLSKGTYYTTDTDKKQLADMTYRALKTVGTFDAETAQKIIEDTYTKWKQMIIEREK